MVTKNRETISNYTLQALINLNDNGSEGWQSRFDLNRKCIQYKFGKYERLNVRQMGMIDKMNEYSCLMYVSFELI